MFTVLIVGLYVRPTGTQTARFAGQRTTGGNTDEAEHNLIRTYTLPNLQIV